MTFSDTESSHASRATGLQFDRYVLDARRGCLTLDGREIVLRPKTFAVLLHLVENPGRLIAKDELFAAVWPGVAVTDDALVQSVGELRRALDDDGPRLIKTIPRRGYRFDAKVLPIAEPATRATDSSVPSHNVSAATLPVARGEAPRHGRFGIALLASVTVAALLVLALTWSGALRDSTFDKIVGWGRGSASDPGTRPGLAVLPLRSQADGSDRDYFVDGLTQDIISALGRFSELTVMSWNAVAPFKGQPAAPGEIARKLSVRYQVEGSVRHNGERVRVAAQLVDRDGRVLWSGSFDEAVADVFALQDKITAQIAGALAIRVTQIEQRRVLQKPTENLEAYDYVLRARPALQHPARPANVEARSFARRAIELDPNYAAAYAALAETYHIDVAMGWTQAPDTWLARAEELATKAVSLNDGEVRARVILGRIHTFHQRYEQAQVEIDRAITINPNDAHGLAGRGNVLMWLGRTDAAIEALELAQRIDPELNAIDRNALSLAYYLKGRYDEAIEQAEINLRQTGSAHFSEVVLAVSYAQQNRLADAVRAADAVRRMAPTFDPRAFGSKFLNPADLERLRDGFRKAGLDQ
jgi:adenylate cyclase